MPVKTTCLTCSARMVARSSEVAKGYGKYCSIACRSFDKRKPRLRLDGYIQLADGKFIEVSAEDQSLEELPWCRRGNYAVTYTTGDRNGVALHRLIMERSLNRELSKLEIVDHIDRNTDNCRRTNLRLTSRAGNNQNQSKRRDNTSGYRGVARRNEKGRTDWYSYIMVEGKQYYIGSFSSPEEAAWMRDQWALALHGNFAVTNFEYV